VTVPSETRAEQIQHDPGFFSFFFFTAVPDVSLAFFPYTSNTGCFFFSSHHDSAFFYPLFTLPVTTSPALPPQTSSHNNTGRRPFFFLKTFRVALLPPVYRVSFFPARPTRVSPAFRYPFLTCSLYEEILKNFSPPPSFSQDTESPLSLGLPRFPTSSNTFLLESKVRLPSLFPLFLLMARSASPPCPSHPPVKVSSPPSAKSPTPYAHPFFSSPILVTATFPRQRIRHL